MIKMLIGYLLQAIVLQCLHHNVLGRPNFVIMFADDVGYGDFQCYGHPTQEPGAVDRLAAKGKRFTQWYSADSLCSPSRSALLTGRYPIRSGVTGSSRVFSVDSSGGLLKSEVTIAEILQEHGYVTGMVGKWHLGINEAKPNDGKHLPSHHGFDFVGNLLPFCYHWLCDEKKYSVKEMSKKCFLYYGDDIYEQPINASTLSERVRDDAIKFISDNKNNDFLLYLSFPQAHAKAFCSPQFCNTSRRGRYGDMINEMSWMVGGVVETLKRHNLDEKTLVFFLSDNGPQDNLCVEGGTAGLLKGIHSVSSFLDGKSITKLLLSNDDLSWDRTIIYYCSDVIMAVRMGSYKIHYRTQSVFSLSKGSCVHGVPKYENYYNLDCALSTFHDPPLVFNLDLDPSELHPLDPLAHRNVIEKASTYIEEHRKTIEPVFGQIDERNPNLGPCCNPPKCQCNFSSLPKKDEL